MTLYWVRVRWPRTGTEETRHYATALERGLFLIGVSRYADVLAQGETHADETSPEAP